MDARLILVAALLAPLHGLGFEHAAWDALLRKHVVLLDGGKASQLRYGALAQERPALQAYPARLSRVGEAPANFPLAFLDYGWALNDFRSSSPR